MPIFHVYSSASSFTLRRRLTLPRPLYAYFFLHLPICQCRLLPMLLPMPMPMPMLLLLPFSRLGPRPLDPLPRIPPPYPRPRLQPIHTPHPIRHHIPFSRTPPTARFHPFVPVPQERFDRLVSLFRGERDERRRVSVLGGKVGKRAERDLSVCPIFLFVSSGSHVSK